MAKRFFYVCAGLFLLALSYHMGARGAAAQAEGQVVGIASAYDGAGQTIVTRVVTSAGDVYHKERFPPWQYEGNIYGANPTPAGNPSWGQVKNRYRK